MIGPKIVITKSCEGCTYCESVSYHIQSDSGCTVHCTHPNLEKSTYIGDTIWKTPLWCPVILSTRELLKRTVQVLKER